MLTRSADPTGQEAPVQLCPTYRHSRMQTIPGAGQPAEAVVELLVLHRADEVPATIRRCLLCAATLLEHRIAEPQGEHAGLSVVDLHRLGMAALTAPAVP